ncbi:MAG: 4-alpha-glucanotransferase [Mizugakiibacter sp.]|uniref:4-alpha-glucanotransferase n=1 Tax=Mizugakiibacter sp. TaxID=1972610 RepID=UPI0031BCD736|nr:4-alpha-glucanotransferase [Xanthomonadaceae bacterium]
MRVDDLLAERRAGVLLHPTALPGATGAGALGAPAEAMLDFLAAAGCTLWQMLPVGPVHADRSPYRALSLYAGGEHLIGTRALRGEAWLRAGATGARHGARRHFLRFAAERFAAAAPAAEREAFDAYRAREADWLPAYALFRVLRRLHRGAAWPTWPAPWRDGPQAAFAALPAPLRHAVEREAFAQFVFHRQWRTFKHAANARGVLLFGDLPIYPAHDSADVWANRRLFRVDARGAPLETAGVPPDAFAPQGQWWGAPVYDWARMAAEDYAWWVQRVRVQAERFDLLRVDHFRGYEAYWAIPAHARSAAEGDWCPGPGAAPFLRLQALPQPPALVAEDLGTITPAVEALRDALRMPGTRVLQFAFDGDPHNPHLPDRYAEATVACTGTHDNDTALGWWRGLDAAARARVRAALGTWTEPMPWPLLRAVLASKARLAVLPMQDLLGLDSHARFNIPGTVGRNWRWRLRAPLLTPALAARMRAALRAGERCA